MAPSGSRNAEVAEEQPLAEINYESLNGLRGVGALCVFFQHCMIEFYPNKYQSNLLGKKTPEPTWFIEFQLSPLSVFFCNGEFWVMVFFVLSGFVLPLKFFKTKRPQSIWGGMLRRYPRLMIPCLVVIALIYTIVKLGLSDSVAFRGVKKKNFLTMMLDGLIATWVGKRDYVGVTWTLCIELWCSIFVYVLAYAGSQYRQRYTLYGIIIAFCWVPRFTEWQNWTNVLSSENGTGRIYEMAPLFIIGTIFADMEVSDKKYRAFDKLRQLNPRMTLVKNILLTATFLVYGSYCWTYYCSEGVDCTFLWIVTFGWRFQY